MTSCDLCGCALGAGAKAARLSFGPSGTTPTLMELAPQAGHDGALAYFCAEHVTAIRVLQSLIPNPSDLETALRGHLYQELDLLAFALEMECAEALDAGREAEAERAQRTRLGVRLAQRLVGNVPAPEISERLQRWRGEYLRKFPNRTAT